MVIHNLWGKFNVVLDRKIANTVFNLLNFQIAIFTVYTWRYTVYVYCSFLHFNCIGCNECINIMVYHSFYVFKTFFYWYKYFKELSSLKDFRKHTKFKIHLRILKFTVQYIKNDHARYWQMKSTSIYLLVRIKFWLANKVADLCEDNASKPSCLKKTRKLLLAKKGGWALAPTWVLHRSNTVY